MYMSVVAMQPDNLQRLQRQNGIHQRLRSLREDSGTIHSHVQIDKDIQGDIPGLAKSRDRTGILRLIYQAGVMGGGICLYQI